MRAGIGRAIDLGTLVFGLLYCGLLVWLSVQPELGLADPAGFAAFVARMDALGDAAVPLGFVLFLALIFDTARAESLTGPRPRLRAAGLVLLVALSLYGAAVAEPFRQAVLATDDPAARMELVRADAPWRWLMRALVLALAGTLVAAHRHPPPGPPVVREDGRYAARWVPSLFGRTPELPSRQWRVLGLMIAAGFFNAYDHQIFSLALKQIQAGLQIDEGRLGYLGSVVRLGSVPGVLLVLLGDVWGRRRLLMVTIVGYTLSTGATALAPGEWSFVVFQFLSRMFGAAEATLAGVVVAEEVDAEHRGWALGVLSALSFLGFALAWVLFATIEFFPLGWRGLYLVGLGPLALIVWLRRRLPETARFEREHARHAHLRGWRELVHPLVALVRAYPTRFAVVAAVGFLMSFSGQPAGFFFPKFVQDVHGIAPAQLTMLGGAVGLGGLVALPLVGRLGDRVGRRPVAMVFIFLNPLAVIGLYHVAGVALVALLFLAMNLTDIGSDMNLGVFARELFATSHRATAGSAAGVVSQLGGSLGLAAESALFGWLGSHGQAISLIALAGLVVPLLVWWGYPETRGRSLEEISPERD